MQAKFCKIRPKSDKFRKLIKIEVKMLNKGKDHENQTKFGQISVKIHTTGKQFSIQTKYRPIYLNLSNRVYPE